MRVVWSPSALRDIRHIYRYIARFNQRAAEDLARELVAAGDSLESFPQRGRPVPGAHLREWALVYPYIIRYRIAGDHVRILRVLPRYASELITHGESGRSGVGRARNVVAPTSLAGQFEQPYGPMGPPTLFTIPVLRYMKTYGLTHEQPRWSRSCSANGRRRTRAPPSRRRSPLMI